MTYTDTVLNHLKKHESLSSMEAFQRYGITRLSACIFTLRRKGYDIASNNQLVKNRLGRNVYVSFYKLNKKDEQVS